MGILGPIEVRIDDAPAALGGPRQRAVLAVLAIHPNQLVSVDRLVDHIWGEHSPATAVHTVRVFVSRLRRAMSTAGDRLITRPPGYVLELKLDELDADRFERLYELGRGALARLDELRLNAREELIEARLAVGRYEQVVSELEVLIREHPFRERPRGQLMLGLYRCGRQAQALEAFQKARWSRDRLSRPIGPAQAAADGEILPGDTTRRRCQSCRSRRHRARYRARCRREPCRSPTNRGTSTEPNGPGRPAPPARLLSGALLMWPSVMHIGVTAY
jgi:DNA-binding SARP family transcriptional activator